MKKEVQLLVLAILASAVCLWLASFFRGPSFDDERIKQNLASFTILEQKALRTTMPKTQYVLYQNDQILGVVSDVQKLEQCFEEVYHERYEEEFPNSRVGLGETMFLEERISVVEYENIDEEIINYMKQENVFSLEAYVISSGGEEVVCVNDIEHYKQAKEQFAYNYIEPTIYQGIKNHTYEKDLEDDEFKQVVVDAMFLNDETVERKFVDTSKIAKSKEEALQYMSYGYDSDQELYTSVEYDTIEGVAWTHGIPVDYLLSINPQLVSKEQILSTGTEIDVTPLKTAMKFQVVYEVQEKVKMYPQATEYIEDDTLLEGHEEVIQEGEEGEKNVKWKITYVNGENQSGEVLSERVVKEAKPRIVKVGTKIEPHIGSGNFHYPVENPRLTCGWCYRGHTAWDLQNAYNRYDVVHASDRGVVVENSYNSINGYYIVIDHGNGYQTYYGHMSSPAFPSVGDIVAQDEVIGNIGMTGVATGPHVHFEIRQGSTRLDPADYLR